MFICIITSDLHNDPTSIICKLSLNLKKGGYGHNAVIMHWLCLNIHHRRAILIRQQEGVYLCELSCLCSPHFQLTGYTLHIRAVSVIIKVLIMKKSAFYPRITVTADFPLASRLVSRPFRAWTE